MAEGLRRHGHDVVLSNRSDVVNTDVVACWGWRVGKQLRAQGKQVLVMERGYLGDRFAWTSLAWNGLNNRGTFPDVSDPSRFRENFKMEPWRHDGDCVVIMGQVPGDMSLQGRDLRPWYNEIAQQVVEAYKLPVLFRNHPQALKRGIRFAPHGARVSDEQSLQSVLSRAAVVVTYNSNSGVDAVIAGVPTVAFDHGSMARGVAATRIGELYRPDREEWASRLAWCQWTMDEIRNGFALEHLLEMEPVNG